MNPSAIKRCPFQLRPVRKNTREYYQLRNSIQRQGILQPILIRQNNELVDGAHRLECAKDLRLTEVPVVVREMTDDEVLQAQVSANTQRIETLDSEIAMRIWKISKRMSIERLAHAMGKSLTWVKMVCKLERLKPEVLAMLDVGKITFRQAFLLAKLPRRHQLECCTLNERELQRAIRTLRMTGRLKRDVGEDVRPMYRPMSRTIEEMESPCFAARVIMNETDRSPIEVWKAALRWVTQIDEESKQKREKQ